MKTFEKDLSELINKHSIENESDTPDYVLAIYIRDCLTAYNKAVRKRDLQFTGSELLEIATKF